MIKETTERGYFLLFYVKLNIHSKKLCVFYHLFSAGISNFLEKGIPRNCQKNSHLSKLKTKSVKPKRANFTIYKFYLNKFHVQKGNWGYFP